MVRVTTETAVPVAVPAASPAPVRFGTARPGEPGLRERKKRQTRQALRHAAVRLVAERGLENVSVDEIAAAADVSSRTFFNYFPTKDDALAGIDPEDIAEISDALANRPPDEEPLVALRTVMLERSALIEPELVELWRARMQIIREYPHLMTAHAASWSFYERALTEAIARRCGLDADRDSYPAVLVAAGVAIVRTMSMRWKESPQDVPLPELLGYAFDILARGLALPPAMAPSRSQPGTSPSPAVPQSPGIPTVPRPGLPKPGPSTTKPTEDIDTDEID
jgi:AcrR family transcriptional regulator